MNLRGLWEIVDNIRLDKTGRAFLVSDDGILITHPDKKRVLKNENIKDQKDVQRVLAGRTEAIELQDKSGKKWISSYARIPDLGWGVVLRQEQKEAYLFSKVMRMQSWIIITLSELMVILASIFMAKVLAQPIKVLVTRVKGVAEGRLDEKIEIKRHDEIGELIKSFNHMTERIKKAKVHERLSAIGEVSAWVAHEFKNSLVSIKSFIQLFPQKHRDKKFIDTFNKVIPEEIKRWERMLKELSDFSSHRELSMARTDVGKIIANLLEMMKQEFIEKRIDIKYNAQNDNLYITADPERLKQVFMNLIINAIKAMPAGGSILVSADLINAGSNRTSYIEIRIKDTGIGIPKSSLGKIFEPFHTTKDRGMGLGLTISRRVIEQHSGNINVESELGEGTTFIVRLPVAEMQGAQERDSRRKDLRSGVSDSLNQY